MGPLMRDIKHLELMPEPEDPSMLTAVDGDAPGYLGEAYGISDQEARELRWPMGPMMRILWPWGAIGFSAIIISFLMLYPTIYLLLGDVFDSEWAYDETGIRDLQEKGSFGQGVRVCIVDTGIDISHPDFENLELLGFRDFYSSNNEEIRDIGLKSHGTLMAGLLVGNDSFVGAAPGVSLSVAIALGPDGKSGNEGMIAQAIRWCRITQESDIISLSLGTEPGTIFSNSSQTVEAVQESLDDGIFVIAAAGNSDPGGNESDVSSPASIEGVIAVGAHDRNGNPWKDSASGSKINPQSGLEREFPNQKPEILAPGVDLWSCISSNSDPPYAFSTGTSDSTVIVAGALSLILSMHMDAISGEDDFVDYSEMQLVKSALASSAIKAGESSQYHDSKMGYGLLDAERWENNIRIEFGIGQ